MPLTANVDEGSSFRGFSEGNNLRKPKQDRGAIQPQHADVDVFGDDEPLVNELDKKFPGFRNKLLLQRQQASEAEESQKAASSPFQTNRDLFTTDLVNQVKGERDIKAAEMGPANITPGAKSVGKGGVIEDGDMNMEAAGSSLKNQGAGMTNNKVAGLPPFYRMKRARFYGQ